MKHIYLLITKSAALNSKGSMMDTQINPLELLLFLKEYSGINVHGYLKPLSQKYIYTLKIQLFFLELHIKFTPWHLGQRRM